jgi:hypothetical protein
MEIFGIITIIIIGLSLIVGGLGLIVLVLAFKGKPNGEFFIGLIVFLFGLYLSIDTLAILIV